MIEVRAEDKTFISWLNKILEKPYYYDIPDIKFFAYSYYRSYNYKSFDAFNFLKGVMAAFEISLEWENKSSAEEFINKYDLKRRIYLKKPNYRFLDYLKHHTNLFWEINYDIDTNFINSKISREELFDRLTEKFKEEIVGNFKIFLISWDYSSSANIDKEELISALYNVMNFQENFYIHRDMVDNQIEIGAMLEYMTVQNEKVDYYNVFNFFNFLRENNVDVPLSKKRLYDKIREYSESNNVKLDYRAKQILIKNFYGTNFSIKIFDFFNGNKKTNFLSYKRYLNVFSHGILLFKHDKDFNYIKSESWDAFQHVTRDVIDVYYFKDELNGKMSGYSVLSKLENLKISIDNLPALLVWKDNIKDYRLIKFEDLDKKFYLDIIVTYVSYIEKKIQQIENEDEIFEQAVNEAINDVSNKRKKEIGMTFQNINYGTQQGNFGHHGKIEDSQFTINHEIDTKDISIESETINELKEVINKTLLLDIHGLETSERLEITLRLQKLVESFERVDTNKETQQKELGKWRQFLENNNQKVLLLMGAMADVVTLSAPLLKLLGMVVK